jgi:predicted permease
MWLERWWLIVRLRLRSLLRRGAVDDELGEEIGFHLDERARQFESRGMTDAAAREAALRHFGGVEARKAECRDARGVWLIDVVRSDLRYTLRSVRRDAAFAVTATATLALCIAALSTVLAIVDAYYLKRLPVAHADELVAIAATRRHPNELGPVSFADYVEFRDRTQTLQGLAAHYSTAPFYVRVGGAGKELNGAVVTANFFPLLGIEPVVGRFFQPDEDAIPDRDRVAVVGHEFWESWLGGRADALGTTLTVNGVVFTVVGIAPASFRGVLARPADIYLPMSSLGVGYRWCVNAFAADCTILQMLGRLAPGRRVADAVAEMPTLVPDRWQRHVDGENTSVIAYAPRTVHHSPSEQRFVAIISSVAGLLIVVGCVNIAGLLAARTTVRAPELALRASLGASRGRLLAQLMIEALTLAMAGGVLGTVISSWTTQLIEASFYSVDAEGHAMDFGFRLQWTVIAGSVGAALAAGIAFGLWPALVAIKSSLVTRAGARVTRARRVGLGLAGVQAAAAVALVCVALLLAASARRVVEGANFDSTGVAGMRLRPRLVQYSPERAQAFHRNVIREVRQLPGVESVSVIGQGVPLFGGGARVTRPVVDGGALSVNFGDVAPGYFDTLRIPFMSGRDFDANDSVERPPVAIVSESLATRLFGTVRVLSETVLIDGRPHVIVGVVRDIAVQTRHEAVSPFVYVPFWQRADEIDARYCIRVSGDAAAALPALVRAVNAVDPDVPVAEAIPLTVQMAGEFRSIRLTAAFAGYAATLTIVLTVVGLYGALAFAVARRTREIGIRLAIGATVRQVVREIVGDGVRVVALGTVAGLALAFVAVRLIGHLLVDLTVGDAVFYTAGAAAVFAAGLTASWFPARTAARIDPATSLRCE